MGFLKSLDQIVDTAIAEKADFSNRENPGSEAQAGTAALGFPFSQILNVRFAGRWCW
jgi:hypothetical protein